MVKITAMHLSSGGICESCAMDYDMEVTVDLLRSGGTLSIPTTNGAVIIPEEILGKCVITVEDLDG